jgi:hypothetical protein
MDQEEKDLTPLERCEAAWAAGTTPAEKWEGVLRVAGECTLAVDDRCNLLQADNAVAGDEVPERIVATAEHPRAGMTSRSFCDGWVTYYADGTRDDIGAQVRAAKTAQIRAANAAFRIRTKPAK